MSCLRYLSLSVLLASVFVTPTTAMDLTFAPLNSLSAHKGTLMPEPASLNNSYKTAAVCFLGFGNCDTETGYGNGDDFTIDTAKRCANEGYTVTYCEPPSYLAGSPCPYNDKYYAGCSENKAQRCKDEGYDISCGDGYVNDSAQVCPYDSSYTKCICNPCDGYTYSNEEATADGYVVEGSCNSCGTTKYKRANNPCTGYYECDCGGEIGTTSCKSGTVTKYAVCKSCCENKCTEDSCPEGNICELESCSNKYCVTGCAINYVEWCTQPVTDCGTLGYSQTPAQCPDGYVKCPYGNTVFCECSDDYQYTCDGANETAGTSKCGDKYKDCGCASGYTWKNGGCVQDRPSCNIGDIFYTDNTCVAATKHNSSKTVLGIVVHVNSNGVGGQIMAPWPIDTNGNKTSSNSKTMYWSTKYIDISSLPNYTSDSSASKDYDSCGNTDKIVAQGNASTYPAAWAARKYAPTEATKGKWCLPAAGIMTNIYNKKNAIQTAISKVGGVSYPSCCNWSSSEDSHTYAWASNFGYNYGLFMRSKDYYSAEHTNTSVRPVLEF